jgi:hypothetical protein
MKWMVRVYNLLLPLYPSQFRNEFGAEMCAVFEQRLNDQYGASRLYSFLLEMLDLPCSVLREHFAARNQQEKVKVTMRSQRLLSQASYRSSVVIISVALLITLGCVILPFYALGLHSQPIDLVAGGQFDPKGIAFYQSPIGSVVYLLGLLQYIALPCILLAFAPLMLLSMLRHWPLLRWQWKLSGVSLMLAASALLLFMFFGTGRLIFIWFID